jgi:hypothetical protein
MSLTANVQTFDNTAQPSGGGIFQEVSSDVTSVQNKLLGPTYPYWQNINSPSQMGMSSNGDLSSLGKDISGIISYVEVLASGSGNASKTGSPLGNKFFLQTAGKCNATDTQQSVGRYIYVNNVPSGNIPFISGAIGTNFSEARGLIPGTMSNLNVLNPFTMLQAFTEGTTPDCQKITMQTIDANNNVGQDTQYVTVVDIQNMDPCDFPNGKNPVTGKGCKEAFETTSTSTISSTSTSTTTDTLPNDIIIKLYMATLAILVIYLVYKIMIKMQF